MPTLVEEICEAANRLPRRKQRALPDVARFLATDEGDIDSKDPNDPDSKAFDVTAAMERALQDIKSGRGRRFREVLNDSGVTRPPLPDAGRCRHGVGAVTQPRGPEEGHQDRKSRRAASEVHPPQLSSSFAG